MKMRRMLSLVLTLGMLFSVGLPLSQAQVQGAPGATQDLANGQLAATMVDQIPVQGRLTDAGGIPLNGNYTVNFWVYNVAAGGAPICGNLVTNVSVTNGLFNSTLDLCATAGAMTGEQLWLGVQVGADPEMTPRQPIYPVPFAYTVRPGAIIQGADSYVFVPGSAFVKNNDTDTTRWDLQVNGAARVYRGGTAGAKYIFFPITLPGHLYGQAVTVKSITVYYKCENGANNYITGTSLAKQTNADSFLSVIADTTDHTSNTASSYTLSVNEGLSSAQGILGFYLTLSFANDTDYIQIGGVKIRLGHQ